MADQTNAEVSDERLTFDHQQQADNYLEALLGYTGGFYGAAIKAGLPAAETVGPIAHIERAARELHRLALNRRSVTSQASEGGVVGWRWYHVTQPNEWQYGGPDFRWQTGDPELVVEPLYAAPVSKRVERLETALRDVINEVLNVSSASYIREPVLTMAIQALHGGRS
jgi:hypothetical protein